MRRDLRHLHAALAAVGLVALALPGAACNRAVVQVETEPGDAVVIVNDNPARGNRFSIRNGSPAEIVATWPAGEQVRATLAVERDVVVKLRRDGDPDKLTGGWLLAASGPRGQAHLNLPPVDADAVAPETTAPVEPAPVELSTEEAFARARELFVDGRKAFELAEYDQAIALFKEAYELIREHPSPDTAEILTNVIFNLAVVYEKSYELTPETERLRKARIMYSQYDEQMAQLVDGWSSSNEAGEVRARIRAIEGRLDKLDGK
ncbi:MAG: tetratricopeptide repeat protein [Nannocystaceae bacterium]